MGYLLQVHDHGNIIDDNDIDSFAGIVGARSEALRVISELIQEGVWGRSDHGRCFVRILNDYGREVCVVDMWEAIVSTDFIAN